MESVLSFVVWMKFEYNYGGGQGMDCDVEVFQGDGDKALLFRDTLGIAGIPCRHEPGHVYVTKEDVSRAVTILLSLPVKSEPVEFIPPMPIEPKPKRQRSYMKWFYLIYLVICMILLLVGLLLFSHYMKTIQNII